MIPGVGAFRNTKEPRLRWVYSGQHQRWELRELGERSPYATVYYLTGTVADRMRARKAGFAPTDAERERLALAEQLLHELNQEMADLTRPAGGTP
jgi:hypothetical protein